MRYISFLSFFCLAACEWNYLPLCASECSQGGGDVAVGASAQEGY